MKINRAFIVIISQHVSIFTKHKRATFNAAAAAIEGEAA